MKVVAEGVETREQLAFLRSRGCDEYQGYLTSRPVRPDEFAAMLRLARSVAADTCLAD
jgi:EAL domain-containing protein (putative c-di-GMP-specific phosphodiesterase class I)